MRFFLGCKGQAGSVILVEREKKRLDRREVRGEREGLVRVT